MVANKKPIPNKRLRCDHILKKYSVFVFVGATLAVALCRDVLPIRLLRSLSSLLRSLPVSLWLEFVLRGVEGRSRRVEERSRSAESVKATYTIPTPTKNILYPIHVFKQND